MWMSPAAFARRALSIALLLVPFLLPGCSGRPGAVARVGSEYITVEQFQDAARSNETRYQGPPDSAKAALLQDLVQRTLLVQEARRLHLIPDSTLERMRRQEADRLAPAILIERLVPHDVPVSDAELAEFHKRRSIETHMMLVLVFTKVEAERAKSDLDRGEDFAAVASRYNPAGMLPPGGDLGFQQPGGLIEPLDRYLYDGPIGRLLGPDEIKGQGWTITKLLERRSHEQPPLDRQKESLRRMIRQRKLREVQQTAFTGIRDQYRVHIEPGAGQAMFARFNAMNPQPAPPAGQPAPAPPDSAGPGRVLARHDGADGKPAVYTVTDAIADLNDPTQQRPAVTNVPLIEHWIELQVVRRVTAIEAKRRRIADEPDVRRRAEERINGALLDRLYDAEVTSKTGTPDSADIRAAYERRRSVLTQLQSAKLLTLSVSDSAAAMRLKSRADSAATFRQPMTVAEVAGAARLPGHWTLGLRDLVKLLPPRPVVRVYEREVHFPAKGEPWEQLQRPLTGMTPGDVGGPVPDGDRWMLFELVSKDQGPQPYQSLLPTVQRALEHEAAEAKRDQRLSRFTDSLRATSKIEIYQQRLKQIPWPVPAASASS